ncbi:MAG: aminotransferase class III-fold pyridoxal phosphate-dependent enzyme [Alphaproteobacteria bacterium]|nr:aminotransferase class III-fold pyridoxal phosphate-dependent enzyme [Alphaproteobacteria bacterium]
MTVLDQLNEIRSFAGTRQTRGLPDDVIADMATRHPDLVQAVEQAVAAHRELAARHADALRLPESDLISLVQAGFVNFYQPEAVQPFVSLAAQGPWIVSTHGAVVHDSGGYGMLGQGHNPATVMAALGKPQVMANVMTPAFAQLDFDRAMRHELGHSRDLGCPFSRFICLNSGSESMTVAVRLADVNARRQTAPGAAHAGKRIKSLAIKGGFHGRTTGPARISDSCRTAYEKHLASFIDHSDLVVIEQNDLAALRAAFTQADADGVFFSALFMEPVQGEGAPGRAVTRAFYDLADQLIHQMGGLLVVDSIQAGLRAQGVLSIVDYPGFQDAACPDVESWSKALNAGQFPLSVLGLSQRAAALYPHGVYGNTMTTNPRALDVACAVLDGITDELRNNIRTQGARFVAELQRIQAEFPDLVTLVQGTGLLFCAELDPSIQVVGFGAVEELCRRAGLGIVHGGQNALRFTPHFGIQDDEIAMMMDLLREVFVQVQASRAA